MKKTYTFSFVLIAGVLGYLLRLWLYGAMDRSGLLPEFHIASILLYLLTAAVLVTLIVLARSTAASQTYAALFPAGVISALGGTAAAAGILLSTLPRELTVPAVIHGILGLCAAGSMGMMAYCRLKKKKPAMLFPAVVTLFFLFHLIGQSRAWSSTPQMQQYLPPMLGCLFLMLTSYYQTELTVHSRHTGRFLLCNGAALFFCLISMNVDLFFLPMALWTVSEAIHFQEG